MPAAHSIILHGQYKDEDAQVYSGTVDKKAYQRLSRRLLDMELAFAVDQAKRNLRPYANQHMRDKRKGRR